MDEVITVNSADMLEAINRSEIDVQIATARRFPRNIEQAKNRIVMLATQDATTPQRRARCWAYTATP